MTPRVHTQRPSTACLVDIRRDFWDVCHLGADLTLDAPRFIPYGGADSFVATDGELIISHAKVREVIYAS